ncbi:MAG TPA: beta-propeller domain-containing protein [Kofleriaceae bacterium]|nr:beta-propeller domain-containing protein [Kofleriaceae bacterium]
MALSACSDDLDGPGEHPIAKTTQLVQYQSCSALETDLKNMVIYEIWADIDRANYWGWGQGGAEGDAAGGAGSGSGGGRQEGVDFSGTNNQEQGVDEADIVKTDGYHIYTLNGNRLHIMGVPNFGELTAESVTKIEGYPQQMLLDSKANRVVVLSWIDTYSLPDGHPLKQLVGYQDDQSGWHWRINQLSKITVLDITNKAAPTLVREVYYEGWYQTARKIDSSIRIAGYSMIEPSIMWGWWNLYEQNGEDKTATKIAVRNYVNSLALADFIPQIYVRNPNGQFTSNSLSEGSCRSFYRPTDSHARGISSIISFDLLGDTVHWDADHIVSNWSTFYASKDTLLLAEPAHDWWWYWWYQDDPDQLNVHAFDISTPGKSVYTGSGRVDGQIVDQFSLDEDNGAIRVATTTGLLWRWWADDEERPTMENHVWVLEDHGSKLDIVGHVGGIAKGERIMSSRFQGNKAYLVTYQYVDPLFTLDLSDRRNPHVVGELKVPGFSTYLHPIADGKLLSIGVDGTNQWRTQVSLFDVSDFAHPALDAALPVEAQNTWGWSEALYDHKAFQYWAPKGLLAIPQSTYAYQNTGNGQYYYRYLSQLVLVNVDPTSGALSIKGRIDHSPYYDAEGNTYWRYTDIRRSIFMGDFVYAISDKAVTAHRVSDLGKTAEQTLPGYTPNDYYWWW